MTELLSQEDFRAALKDAIKGREAANASFSQAWADGKLQRHHFARWAENHYHYVGPFADYLGYIYGNTPDKFTDAKDFLLQNMYEEELADIRHTDLLIRFAESCGTTRERIEDPNNMNAVTRGLQAWCYTTAMREHFAVATAALVVGLESQVPQIYKKQIVPLREVYGFTEDEIEFFDLRRGARRARLPDRARVREHPRVAAALAAVRAVGRRDALRLHACALRHLRGTRRRAGRRGRHGRGAARLRLSGLRQQTAFPPTRGTS
jgi:pyrroloquinoline-quinone synthase